MEPKKLRSSERREEIYRFVAAHASHPTAEEILAGVRRTIPGVGLATVYRNLDQLVSEGRLSRTIHGGVARYDAEVGAHHHFTCERCGEVSNVEVTIPRELIRSAVPRSVGLVQSASIDFRGVCRRCR